MFRMLLIGASSLALSAAPAAAVPPPSAMIERAGAAQGDSALTGDSWLPPLLFAAIILGGILLATGVFYNDDDGPKSP